MVLYAGDDTETCANAPFTPDAYIYNQADFTWATHGDGSFDDITAEHPTYTFGDADKTEGKVELTLTGTSALNDNQQSSTVAISLLPSIDPSHTPGIPSGATEIDLRLTSQSEYLADEIGEVCYFWSIEPSTAGILTSVGNRAQVKWSSDYRGQANISYRYENPCGSTAISEPILVNVFNSTGINEQEIATIDVYPNPAKDMIHLKTHLEGDVVLHVVDLMGKVVYESHSSSGLGTATIATSSFGGSGIYTLQVIQNDNVSNIKLVIIP
jgi:hypothetical protein